jgi:hypothetical protein
LPRLRVAAEDVVGGGRGGRQVAVGAALLASRRLVPRAEVPRTAGERSAGVLAV